jgi:Short C-terminal domain
MAKKKSDGLFEALMGRKRDERVNVFGFVPKAEKQRVRQLHAAERTAEAAEELAKAQKASVADELAKLVKLRDEGALTQTEFDVQKKKLLAG